MILIGILSKFNIKLWKYASVRDNDVKIQLETKNLRYYYLKLQLKMN